MVKRRGISYKKRIAEVNKIYDRMARYGVPNREIWRRYIYPRFGISERTFYNLLKASAEPLNQIDEDARQLLLFSEEDMNGGGNMGKSPFNWKDNLR